MVNQQEAMSIAFIRAVESDEFLVLLNNCLLGVKEQRNVDGDFYVDHVSIGEEGKVFLDSVSNGETNKVEVSL